MQWEDQLGPIRQLLALRIHGSHVVCVLLGHTWRRCDSIPRVGAYVSTEARLSSVLEACAQCGLTSDHNIVRCVTANDFDSITAIVSRGASSIHDVLRYVVGCVMVVPVPGFEVFGGADGLPCVWIPLQAAMTASAPVLVNTPDIVSIILE